MHFANNPFTLGVASGEPTASSITLWTRLAPDPLKPNGGMGSDSVSVSWEMAEDAALKKRLAAGTVVASRETVHSVRVNVQGLKPERHYWYRFSADGKKSTVGRTKTLPSPDAKVSRIKFATASCQHFEEGLFVAYDHMAADGVDFCLHLGDYIYGVSRGTFRNHNRKKQPVSLEDYRLRHALYKTDRHLQAAQASFPFLTVFDNHDALKDVDLDSGSLAQRAAAYQAWYEHMPIVGGYTLGNSAISTYSSYDFGDLLRLTVLDTRQYRDNEDLCRDLADPNYGFGIYRPTCNLVDEVSRTMLGAAQESWAANRFSTSEQRWNAIASTTLFSPLAMHHNGKIYRYESSWDYYPENRKRLLAAMKAAAISNPVILSADIHSNLAIDLRENPEFPDSEILAAELLTTSISSGWPDPLDRPIKSNLINNPHVRHYDSSRRGYMVHEITPRKWLTSMRVIDDAQSQNAKVSNQARVLIKHGKPGIHRLY